MAAGLTSVRAGCYASAYNGLGRGVENEEHNHKPEAVHDPYNEQSPHEQSQPRRHRGNVAEPALFSAKTLLGGSSTGVPTRLRYFQAVRTSWPR